jgi:4-diphosphocytidyl-2-C-methyl-D-erythritol kinase
VSDGWLETEARAKLNLLLRIFPRGPDGFHPLETIFCRIDLAERVRLRIDEETGIRLRVQGPESAPDGPENLAARAASLFMERAGLRLGVEIELEKWIPPGSGLGGGSSDAAAVLRLLDQALGAPLAKAELVRLAAGLGSDVTFFTVDTSLAVGRGRGERIEPCPGLEPRPMLVVLPDLHVSTAEAYGWWDDHAGALRVRPVEHEIDGATLKDWDAVARLAHNDFEPAVFQRHSRLRLLKERLCETQPSLSLLSGSGSALFAVYETDEDRRAAVARLERTIGGARLVSVSGPL